MKHKEKKKLVNIAKYYQDNLTVLLEYNVIIKNICNPCKIFDILDRLYIHRNLEMTIILNFFYLIRPLYILMLIF